jgi:hypothetical protein
MSVGVTDEGVIRLSGVCPIEDAEPLLRLLTERAGATVDWGGCEQAHAAVIQVLLAARPRIVGHPTDSFLSGQIAPLIGQA